MQGFLAAPSQACDVSSSATLQDMSTSCRWTFPTDSESRPLPRLQLHLSAFLQPAEILQHLGRVHRAELRADGIANVQHGAWATSPAVTVLSAHVSICSTRRVSPTQGN